MNQQGSRKRQRHLIIGNSAAALNAVKAIRENDSADPITLVSAENHYAYSPVLLPYYVSKKIRRSALFLADQSFYQQNGVELTLGNPATRVDPQNQQVQLANKDILEYDKLLIATGSSPKALGIPGEDLAGVFTLKTVDDADKLVKAAAGMEDIVIIGGGADRFAGGKRAICGGPQYQNCYRLQATAFTQRGSFLCRKCLPGYPRMRDVHFI